jgi:RNA polymerase sigma-32 factor
MTSTALALKQSSHLIAAPIGSLDAYIERVTSLPVLSREEEIQLAESFRNDGDLDAARALVLSHLRFVVHVARGYMGYGLPVGDLIQEGNVGLRNWRLVRVATTKAQRKLFFNLRRMKKNLGWLSEDETRAVARDLGVETREVREMEQRLAARDLSFDPVPVADDGEGAYSPAAYLPADGADPAVAVEQAEWEDAASDSLAIALEQLDPRSRRIIETRWLAEDRKLTLHDLAAEFGVSAERVRQIEAQAIKKLRGFMS